MQPNPAPGRRARYFGLAMIPIGFAAWWYNWHLAATSGSFYIKLTIFGPLAIFGGLLMVLRPQWAGPLRPDSSRAHKTALGVVLGAMFLVSGIDFYLLMQKQTHRPTVNAVVPRFTPASASKPQALSFLGETWQLRSFNQKGNAQWEFTAGESINDWKSLITVIDRPDARNSSELDRLAEGVMNNYKSHNGRILMAKTLQDQSGAPYNYIVAAFEEPAKKRFELNFVKIALGPKNAMIVVYGVRVSDPEDYTAKAKAFLNEHSSELGKALEQFPLPDVSRLPRTEF